MKRYIFSIELFLKYIALIFISIKEYGVWKATALMMRKVNEVHLISRKINLLI